MCVYGVAGFVAVRGARVPDHQLVVIADTAEQALVQQVPGNVLHHGSVASEDSFSVDYFVLLNVIPCYDSYYQRQ